MEWDVDMQSEKMTEKIRLSEIDKKVAISFERKGILVELLEKDHE